MAAPVSLKSQILTTPIQDKSVQDAPSWWSKAYACISNTFSCCNRSTYADVRSTEPLRRPIILGHRSGPAELTRQIKENPGMTELRLEGCRSLTDEHLRLLAALPRLTHLTICGCSKITGSGLKYLPSLKYLTLDRGAISFDSLPALSSLYGLNITNSIITDTELYRLTRNMTALEQLKIDECSNITDEGISQSITHLTSLKDLHLEDCNITDKSLEKISALSHLTQLNLRGCSKITDKGLEHLAQLPSLQVLNCTNCNVTIKGLEKLDPSIQIQGNIELFHHAISSDNTAVVSLLIKRQYLTEDERYWLFNKAVDIESLECVKLFLAHGFDPHREVDYYGKEIAPFQLALNSNSLRLMAVFLLYQKDQTQFFSSSKEKDIEKLLTVLPRRRKPIFQEGEYEQSLARGLGSLVTSDKPRVYSSHVNSKFRAVATSSTQCLLNTPSSIAYMINPMIDFVAKETLSHPEFAVYVSPMTQQTSKQRGLKTDLLGEYIPDTGDINLYVLPPELISTDPISINLQDLQRTTLLHELAHKMVDNLKWHSKLDGGFAAAVELDIAALERDHWKNCHKSVALHLKGISQAYPKEKLIEEYLVRTAEIIADIARENPTYTRLDIEIILRRDIPSLYTLFKYFISEVEAYNRDSSTSSS